MLSLQFYFSEGKHSFKVYIRSLSGCPLHQRLLIVPQYLSSLLPVFSEVNSYLKDNIFRFLLQVLPCVQVVTSEIHSFTQLTVTEDILQSGLQGYSRKLNKLIPISPALCGVYIIYLEEIGKNILLHVMMTAMEKNEARQENKERDRRDEYCLTVHKVEQELESWG